MEGDPQSWFIKFPRLYERQVEILKSARFSLNETALGNANTVEFAGFSKADPQRKLIVRFPEAFPSCPPLIFDDKSSELLSRHHRGDSRQLCLFGFGHNRWNATLSVADALNEAEELISKFKPGNSPLDGESPEPITRTVPYVPQAAILVPPPISTFDDYVSSKLLAGKFLIKFVQEGDFKRETIGRGVIIQATTASKTLDCSDYYKDLLGDRGKAMVGDWFYLQDAPTHKNFGEILHQCLQKSRSFRKSDYYWIGLVFREESMANTKSRLTWLVCRAVNQLSCFHAIRTFPYLQDDRFARIPGLEGLGKKTVMLIGCGSLGSKIAANLAASGVRRFVLVDYDYFEPNNSVRHELGVENFGLNKEKALMTRLNSLNPEVSAYSTSLHFQVGSICSFEEHKRFMDMASHADIIIDATAIHSVSHYINELSFDLRVPVLFASVTNGAWGGEVVRVVPGMTPCWICWLEQYSDHKPPIAPTPGIFPPGCDQPSFTGTTYDLGCVANLATGLAVETLLPDCTNPDYRTNYIRWSGRDAKGEPLPLTERLSIQSQPQCELCDPLK